jgi:hypothetical protein
MVEGLRPDMLWDEVKTRAGGRAISPAHGVLLVKLGQQAEEKRSRESED